MTIALIIIIAAIAVLLLNGQRILKKKKKRIADISQREGSPIEELAYVPYHGGLPDLSKPQKLTLGLSGDYLLLITNDGSFAKFPLQGWLKLEKFTTLRKHDMKQRSMVLWGPLNNLMFKDQVRHFISINYRDPVSGSTDNHVLIEHNSEDERNALYERLDAAWRRSAGRDR